MSACEGQEKKLFFHHGGALMLGDIPKDYLAAIAWLWANPTEWINSKTPGEFKLFTYLNV